MGIIGLRPGLKIALCLLVLAGALYLFVYPARTYLEQRHEMASLERTVSVLSSANKKLRTEYKDLQQPWYVRQVARTDYGLVGNGQVAYSVLPPPARPVRAADSHAGAGKHSPSPWYAPLEFWHRL